MTAQPSCASLWTPRRRAFSTVVGMLDVDRVVMILPQVHLRNGESAETSVYASPDARGPHTMCGHNTHVSGELSRAAFPHARSSPPALLSQGAD